MSSADDPLELPASDPQPTAAPDGLPGINPYAASIDQSPLLAADLVATEVAPRRPHPGLGMAIVWTIVIALAQIAFSLAVVVPVMVVVGLQGKSGGQMQSTLDSLQGVLLVGATLTTLVCAWGISRWMLGRDYLRLIGWRGFAPLQLLWVVLLVLPLGTTAGEVAAMADEVLPSFGAMLEEMSELPLWMIFVGGCLLPAVGEEIFFRGFVSRGVIGNYGVWIGALFTSLLFGLLHIDPVQICGTIVLGLGFQYVFLTTRSLLLPIIGHLLNNMLAFAVVAMADETSGDVPDEIEHVPLRAFLAGIAVLLPLLGLLYQTRTRWVLPDGSEWSARFASCETPPQSLGAQPTSHSPQPLLLLALLITYPLLVAALLLLEV